MIWAEILKVTGEGDIFNTAAAVPRDEARLAVDEIEVKLRRFIDDVLPSKFGSDYWKAAIPQDVQDAVKKLISERNRSKVVTRIDDPLTRLQYANIMDYHKIIDKNWDLFEDRFGSREDLKSHFLALKNYRNPLGHVRELDPIDRKRGEASILWFRRTFSPASDSTSVPNGNQETTAE